MTAKIWYFGQNNSGGVYSGALGVYVIAESEEAALAKLKAGRSKYWYAGDAFGDCPCCGPRWATFGTELTSNGAYVQLMRSYRSIQATRVVAEIVTDRKSTSYSDARHAWVNLEKALLAANKKAKSA